MERYTKVVDVMEQYFTKEYVKIKHHKNKIREISEHTVLKAFASGSAEVLVYIVHSDREILLDRNSDPEEIQRYLGKRFLKKL